MKMKKRVGSRPGVVPVREPDGTVVEAEVLAVIVAVPGGPPRAFPQKEGIEPMGLLIQTLGVTYQLMMMQMQERMEKQRSALEKSGFMVPPGAHFPEEGGGDGS